MKGGCQGFTTLHLLSLVSRKSYDLYHLELTFVTPSFAIRNSEREHFQAEIEKVVCRGRKTALAEGNKLPQADKKLAQGIIPVFAFYLTSH